MNNQDLKKKIASEFASTTPDILEKIKFECNNVEQEAVAIDFVAHKKKYNWAKYSAVAAALALVCMLGYRTGLNRVQAPASEVSVEQASVTPTITAAKDDVASIFIDVNPSIEVTVDSDYKVSDVKALNYDARAVVDQLDVKGMNTNTAIQTVVGALYMNGYLQEADSAILISVDVFGGSEYDQVYVDTTVALSASSLNADVVIQRVDQASLMEEAKTHNVSVGKLEFVDTIIEKSEEYTSDDVQALCDYTIDILDHIFNGINQGVDEAGNNSEKLVVIITDNAVETVNKVENSTADVVTDATKSTGNAIDSITNSASEAVNTITDSAANAVTSIVDEAANTASQEANQLNERVNEFIWSLFGY